jgi:hypothetical protein
MIRFESSPRLISRSIVSTDTDRISAAVFRVMHFIHAAFLFFGFEEARKAEIALQMM